MGKGDQRTRRGKLYRGTYGKTRRHKRKKAEQPPAARATAKAAAKDTAKDTAKTTAKATAKGTTKE